jgi:6-phosphogluconolactonase (cycloisomerase 2 family)
VSRDGTNVYVPAQGDDSMTVFERDLVTGDLTYLNALVDGTDGVDGLQGAHAATETPDNRYLLVTGWHDDAVAVFSIGRPSGDLSFVEAFFDGTDGVDGLFNAAGIATDPSGSHVYATGRTDNALVTFSVQYPFFLDGFESGDTTAWDFATDSP